VRPKAYACEHCGEENIVAPVKPAPATKAQRAAFLMPHKTRVFLEGKERRKTVERNELIAKWREKGFPWR
jgi:hypothetical protein